MKKRWAILFWTSLAGLIGMSWLTTSFGGTLWQMLNVALVGMIGASVVAFIAMKRSVRAKWPAVVVLLCAAPMAMQMVRLGGFIVELVSYAGPSAILLFGGSLGTAGVALVTLMLPLAELPPPPPIAPARVVEE